MKAHYLTVKVTRGSQIDVIGDVAEIIGISPTTTTFTAPPTTTVRVPGTRAPYGSLKGLKTKGKGGKGGKKGGKKKMLTDDGMSMSEVILNYFERNPTRVFHAREIGTLIHSKGFKTDGHAAMANLFAADRNAPIERVGRGIYKYKNGELAAQ